MHERDIAVRDGWRALAAQARPRPPGQPPRRLHRGSVLGWRQSDRSRSAHRPEQVSLPGGAGAGPGLCVVLHRIAGLGPGLRTRRGGLCRHRSGAVVTPARGPAGRSDQPDRDPAAAVFLCQRAGAGDPVPVRHRCLVDHRHAARRGTARRADDGHPARRGGNRHRCAPGRRGPHLRRTGQRPVFDRRRGDPGGNPAAVGRRCAAHRRDGECRLRPRRATSSSI